jgi:hypothetical protein
MCTPGLRQLPHDAEPLDSRRSTTPVICCSRLIRVSSAGLWSALSAMTSSDQAIATGGLGGFTAILSSRKMDDALKEWGLARQP